MPIRRLPLGPGGCIVRLLDTPPVSPRDAFVTCFRLPRETLLPEPGDAGQAVVIELAEGAERVLAETRGREPQLEAQVHRGFDNRTLFFSDADTGTWTPQGMRLELETGERRAFDAPLRHANPRSRGPTARAMERAGSCVILPDRAMPERRRAPADGGVRATNPESDSKSLVHPIAGVFGRFPTEPRIERFENWRVYAFHAGFAPVGDRILFSLRWFGPGYGGGAEPMHDQPASGVRFAVCTPERDGSNLFPTAGPEPWRHGGHPPPSRPTGSG